MRLFVRLLSALIGLALAAAGVLLALEVGWGWWRPGRGPLFVPWDDWRDRLAGLSWNAPPVHYLAIAVAVVGLLLIVAAAAAGRRAIRLTDPATEVSVTTSPRSLARLVGVTVRAQENVAGAKVTTTAKKIRVRATSRLETEGELRPRLLKTVSGLLEDVPLVRRPKVSVVVDSPKDRR
ncbi:DUF6286 domain-containing protein [Amycolatopsis sp. QT-25]|uniref:DUF6286 domain-containing protein n=1 Tax=Amycolatopsis sp. QT-25 TaxID=3034022 RepID=UPI0023EB77DF|nr:DUF6286 domain-containing protein [Amycolatopsis sp. QT-25]WET82066.1 DUF6286 domain-containing protein [Amycolatopsis sp. QT-25]